MAATNTASMGMRFYASGVELVQQTYSQLAASGKRMWAEIASGQDRLLPGMKAVNAASQEFNQGLQSMAANVGSFGRILSAGGAAGIAVAAALGAVVLSLRQAREAMSFGDEIADTAAKIHAATDELQEYRYAIHAVGGEVPDADAGLKAFIERLGEARSGLSTKALKPFESLGFTKESLQQFKDAGDLIPMIADKIAALGSEADQAAVAKRLGLEPLLPLLRQGAAGVERLRQEAHNTGAIMDADLVQRLGAANDRFEQMSRVIDLQLKQSFAGLAPVLVDLMEHTARWAAMLSRVIDRFSSLQNRSMGGLKDDEIELRQQLADIRAGKQVKDFAQTNSMRSEAIMRFGLLQGGAMAPFISAYKTEEEVQHDLNANMEAQWRRTHGGGRRGRHTSQAAIDAAWRSGAAGGTSLADPDAAEEARRRKEKAQREHERALEETAARDQRFATALQSIRDKTLAAQASEASTIDQRLKVELDRLAGASQAAAEDRERQVQRKELTRAQADQLAAAQVQADEAQRAALQAKATKDRQEVQTRFDADMAGLQRDLLDIYSDLAVTVRDRQAMQRAMLEMEQAQRRQALEDRIKSDPNLSPEDAEALRRKQGKIDEAENAALADRQSGLRDAIYGAWHDAIGDLLQGDIAGMFEDFFGGLAKHFADKLKDRMADVMFDLGEQLLKDLVGGGGGGIGGFLGDAIGFLFGGGRAAGGSAQPGYYYRAAEHDTELALIGRQGQVFNHQDTVDLLEDAVGARQGGGTVLNATFAPVYNVTGTAQELERLRQQMAKDKAEFPGQVVGVVNDAHKRGMISTART